MHNFDLYSKILMEFSLLHPTSSIITSDCYSFSNNSFFDCYNCKKINIVCKHFLVISCLDCVVFSFYKGTLLDLQFEFSFSFTDKMNVNSVLILRIYVKDLSWWKHSFSWVWISCRISWSIKTRLTVVYQEYRIILLLDSIFFL